jgi:hypothetical protein
MPLPYVLRDSKILKEDDRTIPKGLFNPYHARGLAYDGFAKDHADEFTTLARYLHSLESMASVGRSNVTDDVRNVLHAQFGRIPVSTTLTLRRTSRVIKHFARNMASSSSHGMRIKRCYDSFSSGRTSKLLLFSNTFEKATSQAIFCSLSQQGRTYSTLQTITGTDTHCAKISLSLLSQN